MQPQAVHPADEFSALAYRCVVNGIIRFEDRRQLARAAVRLGIRPFEAQLLIACAIRARALEEGQDQGTRERTSISRQDSGEKLRGRALSLSPLQRLALLLTTAATLDTLLIYLWFS